MKLGLCFTLTALLSLCFAAVRAQNTESLNAEETFTTPSIVYNRSGLLQPLRFNLYRIPVPANITSPDLLLTLNATTGSKSLALYCSPDDGSFGPNATNPGPGFAAWSSDLASQINQVFISKNDPTYRARGRSNTSSLSFVCTVINGGTTSADNYTLTAELFESNQTLVASEQAVLSSLYSRCCRNNGSCGGWRETNRHTPNGATFTDFCNFPGQICSPSGNLYRLHLSAYNLSCAWPGDLLSQFSELKTLRIGQNPRLTGNTNAVVGTLGNLTSLQFLNLNGDTGLRGPLDQDYATDTLCTAAEDNLASLRLNGIGLSGTLPSCLYSEGSNLILLDLANNNFTGRIQDTIANDSSLQLLNLANNRLSGPIPPSLANMRNLVSLNTSYNRMNGSIPEGIGAIPTLQSFAIHFNNYSGPIPDDFGFSHTLQVFDAKSNRLTMLPEPWIDGAHNTLNSSLVNIRVSQNRIEGIFPVGLAHAPRLSYLILNENNMTGELPGNGLVFPAMIALNVSRNRVNGSIPTALGLSGIFSRTPQYAADGRQIETLLDLSYNRLSGPLPEFLAAGNIPAAARIGIFLQGNSLNVNCQNSSFNYIRSICPSGAQTTTSSQSVGVGAPSSSTGQATNASISGVGGSGRTATPLAAPPTTAASASPPADLRSTGATAQQSPQLRSPSPPPPPPLSTASPPPPLPFQGEMQRANVPRASPPVPPTPLTTPPAALSPPATFPPVFNTPPPPSSAQVVGSDRSVGGSVRSSTSTTSLLAGAG